MKFVNQQETVKTQLEGGVWELGPNVLSERGEKKKKKTPPPSPWSLSLALFT